jgi:hypothetical protein
MAGRSAQTKKSSPLNALILLHFFSSAMKYYREIAAFSCDIAFTRNASDALQVICMREKT